MQLKIRVIFAAAYESFRNLVHRVRQNERPLSYASTGRKLGSEAALCAVDDIRLGFWNEAKDANLVYAPSVVGEKDSRGSQRRHSVMSTASDTECGSIRRRSVTVTQLPFSAVVDDIGRQELEDSVATPSTPGLDLSEVQIQLVQSRQTLSRPSPRGGDNIRTRRDAVYLQGMQPEYNSATHTLVFHSPQAVTLAML